MSIYTYIKQAFPNVPIVDISDYYTRHIEPAKRIYQNKPPWKDVVNTGIKKKKRARSLTNMAKVICDKLATMTFSEQCDIAVSDKEYNDVVMDTLEANCFWERFPEFLSRSYALGGGVLKGYIENGEICINYINADRFFPTKWNSRQITEGVFCNEYVQNGCCYKLFEYHTLTDEGVSIRNVLYKSDSKSNLGTVVPVSELFPQLSENVIFKGIKKPIFVYFKPAVGNNMVFDLPLGLSVFANAIDTLKEVDIVFDSLEREFMLGKKRIIVPSELIKTLFDDNGNEVRYFDINDEAFQALRCEEAEKLNIIDNTQNLRVTEHTDALKRLLDILGMQLGFSPGTLSFDSSSGVKTATEVAADEKDTLRTVQNNKNIITEVIENLADVIINLTQAANGSSKEYTVSVNWQDNIIGDDNTRIENNINLVQSGLKSKLRAIMDAQNIDEKAANEELQRIAKENDIDGGVLDGDSYE